MSITTETAPDSCPFCGEGVIIMEDGRECCSQNRWVTFKCFTNWHPNYWDPRVGRSFECIEAERERLTRERDEAREAHTKTLNQIGDLCVQNANLLARVKRLEEAGDRLRKYLRIAVGPNAHGWETPNGVDIGKRIEAAIADWTKSKEAKPIAAPLKTVECGRCKGHGVRMSGVFINGDCPACDGRGVSEAKP